MGWLSPLFTDVRVDMPLAETPALAIAALEKRIATREIRGTVNADGIVLRLRGMLPHRPYQPAFRGQFDSTASPMRLSGRIRTSGLLRLFIWWWLGFAGFWTIGALAATWSDPVLRWMPLGGVLMLAVGYGFFTVVNKFVADLAHTLEMTIRDAVSKSPNNKLQRTRGGSFGEQ